MLNQAMAFIQNNTKKSTYVNPITAKREDRTEYPIKAIREIILNALIHRDYSIYTENEPIRNKQTIPDKPKSKNQRIVVA